MKKKILDIAGFAYTVMVLFSAVIMAKEELAYTEGFFESWETIVSCLWKAGLWPVFLPMYL